MTAEGDDLRNPSRIVRYVPYGKMRRDEDDNCIGPFLLHLRDAQSMITCL